MLVTGLDNNPHFPQFRQLQGWNLGEEAFQKASIRFLFIFPSPMGLRSVSASHITLYGILKSTYGDDIFVDFWMEPNAYDRSYMDKHFPQKIIGFFSHHTWEDFDIVGCSLAITMLEPMQMIKDLHDAGFPVWYKDRKNDDKTPLLCAGGVGADQSAVLDNIVDFTQIGMGERNLPLTVKYALEAQAKFGSVKKGKEWIISQLQDHPGIYNPRRYRYNHKIVNGHFESEYLGLVEGDTGARQLRADTSLPPEVIKMGDNMLRLSLPGGSHHKVSLQSSLGAVTGDTLIETRHGLQPIASLVGSNPELMVHGKLEPCDGIVSQGMKDIYRIHFSDGTFIDCSDDHKFVDKDLDETKVTLAKDLQPGFEVLRRVEPVLGVNSSIFADDNAEMFGFFFGDGGSFYDGRLSSVGIPYGWGLQWTVRQGYEYSTYLPAIQKFFGKCSVRHRKEVFSDGVGISDLCVSNSVYDNLVNATVDNFNLSGGVYTKSLPAAIYSAPVNVRYLFLKGYLQADGSVVLDKDNDRWQIQWGSSSETLVRDIILLFNSLGYQAYSSVVPAHIDSRGVRYSAFYSCCLTQSSSLRFIQTLQSMGYDTGKFDVEITEHQARKGHQYKKYLLDAEGYQTLYVTEVENLHQQKECFDVVNTTSHLCDYSLVVTHQCHGSFGTCNFCAEGWLYGSWRERSEEDYRQGIITAKKSAMADGFSWFSFNGNFLENYVQSLQDAARYFHKIGSINIRIDSLAGSIKLNGENNYIRLLKELGTTSVACLHGSTLVETKRGLIPISEVKVGDEVVSLAFNYSRGIRTNPTSVWRKVTHVLPRGKKELYKFTTHDNHSFIATLDHVIPTCDCQRIGGIHDVPVEKLIGKRVMVREDLLENSADNSIVYVKPLSARCKYQRPEKINTSLALLLGWLMGDGYVSDKGSRFYFGEKDAEAYQKIKEILTVEGIPYSEEQTPGVFGVVQRINVNSQGFTDFVQACGLLGASVEKTFPSRLYTASTACQLAFLSGYFSADGRCRIKNHLGKKSLCISASTISPSILNGVATLLTSLGIKNRIEGRPQNTGLGKHDLYTINLKGNDSFKSFLDNVKFLQSYKQVDSSELGSKRTVYCDTIEKCEFYAVDDCWDLTIEGEPYFTANGVYVHNCPIEGISQRMRDFLNKNLSEDDILTVDNELFKRRMIRVKHGAIFTGYEQKEDWEEHAALTDKELELRDKWNANSMIQYNFTWLVFNNGTPLFYMPRRTTALAWKQFFSKEDGKDFYYYPYMYLSDRGIKAKESSQPKDTIIQQFLIDCPAEFLEDTWVKPMLKGEMENFSTDQVRRLRTGLEKWGINPRSQLLERDFKKHVHQHMKLSTADEVIEKFGQGDINKYLEWIRNTKLNGTGCCLKTPATEWKHNQQKCFGCSSCKTVDEDAKAYGIERKPHIAYMHNRPLKTNYNLMDIKTALMQNTPSFYYRLIFKITEPGRFIAKEGLVRRWLSKATDYDESLVKNFRCISTALHKWLDYEELTSTYAGYELCIMGFQDKLDLDKFKEIAKQVNAYSKDSGIQLADIQSAQESGGTSFYVLHSFEVIAEKEDFDKFIKKMCTEERRLYEGGTSMPETFAMSIDYKILRGKKGYRVLVLCPPRFNIFWGEGLKRWTAPKVADHIVDWNIMAIFTKTPDGRYISVLDGKPFETSGFVHAEQTGEGFADKGDEGIEVDGA